jgi:hypothetical protein
MSKHVHPEYHKWMLDAATHPTATRRVKFEETRYSLVYKTGAEVYKIRKTGPIYSSLAIKEVFAREALLLGRRWAPQVYQAVTAIVKTPAAYALGGEGAPLDYAVRMTQLPEHHWAEYLATEQKLTATTLGRIARYLAEHHAQAPAGEHMTAAGRPEHFIGLQDEVCYQVKRFVGTALTQGMFDLVARPMAHFLEHGRKLFLKRQKKNRAVDGHGAFSPRHVFVKTVEVEAIGILDGQQKYRVLDAANDVATFANGLRLLGAPEEAALFVKRYAAAAHDRDLEEILPSYQILQSMRAGLSLCEWASDGSLDEERQAQATERAHQHFALAVEVAKELPKL